MPHEGDIQVAVAQLIGYRQNVIVPNVSWGLGLTLKANLYRQVRAYQNLLTRTT